MAEVQTIAKPKSVAKPAASARQVKKPQDEALVQTKVKETFHLPNQPAFTKQKVATNGKTQGLWKQAVQTKLKIGQPGDKYEQEADAMADRVVQAKSETSAATTEDSPGLQAKAKEEPAIQAKEEEETPELQAQAEEEPEVQAKTEEEPEVQTKEEDPEPEVQTMQEETEEAPGLQAKDGDGNASDHFESQLNSANTGGSPLAKSTMSQVQPHFDTDFSNVRVHTDSNAVSMNQQLGSQAFTHKNHIYFNEGKYNPGSNSGDHLISHELTHTVQQGAAIQAKPEEEAEEEIQVKPEAPQLQKQATDAAGDDGASDDTAPAANAENQGNDSSPTDNTPPPVDTTNTPDASANAPNTPPPSSPAGPGDSGAGQDLNKDNPITQRAAEYQEEEITAVEQLGLEGSSDQAMTSFASASASQVAMTLPGLGDTLSQKLGSEKQAAAQDAPKLTAGTTGAKDQKLKPVEAPGAAADAAVKDGVTEGEPGAQKLDPHKEGAPLPRARKDEKLDEGKPAAAESGGFFSWLFDKFKDVMGGVKTVDKGMNTKAGAAPKIDTKGKANPDRAENVSKEGKEQIAKEKDAAAAEINKNPGQENIQPLYFEEPKEVVIDTQIQAQVLSEQDQTMAEFVNMPIPETVRAQADLDLAPTLEKSMAQPKAESQQAAQKRDSEKKAAIADSQAQVDQLNKDAEQQQQTAVNENRQAVAAEQKRGIEEANTQMNAFSTEADKEKAKANKNVKERIKKDQDSADKQIKQAEADAQKEKKKGEAKAKAEKEKAKKDSGEKSWWGKFKDAVSSAVSWLTEKIGQIFDAIRKAVKFIIDKAKNAALALIEAGRKWIVEKLDQFGNWLKEKANKYLKHFPALRKRVNAFIDEKVNAAKAAVNKIADGLKKGVEALANALSNAINSLLNAFETALTAAVQVAGALLKGDFKEALKIAFFATCKVAGIDPNPIMNFINKAGETIGLIFKDPAGFFSNVAGGVKLGIDQFVTNIKKHLISGLIGWLTGAMSDVPIQMPEKFDLKGVFSLVMQILGLTYERIRAKVVKRIGPKGEQVVSGMEKTFQFVKDLITKGPIVLWERVKEKFTEIKEMAMDKIRNLITIEVVKAGVKWLLSLLNPASAIVKAVLMLYDFVMFLIERKDQIVGFVMAVFDTVGPLARGQLKKAGNAVEGAMGRGVPVILGLLANLLGLGGIGKSVSKVIKTIQKPVDKVVDPIIGWLVKQGKKLFKKGKAGLNNLKDRILNWRKIKKPIKVGKESHTLLFKKSGKKFIPIMRSTEGPLVERVKTAIARVDLLSVDSNTKNAYKAKLQKLIAGAGEGNYVYRAQYVLYEERTSGHRPRSMAAGSGKSLAAKSGKKINEVGEMEAEADGLLVKISQVFNTLPASLFGDGTEEGKLVRPESKITFGGKQPTTFGYPDESDTPKKASQDGISVDALLSTNPSGTERGSSASHNSILVTAIKGNRGAEVTPGHLLNHSLYGSGTKAENLVPITKSVNTSMAQDHESKLREHVIEKNEVAKYKVVADWSGARPTSEKGTTYWTGAEKVMPRKLSSTLSIYEPKPNISDEDKKDFKNWKLKVGYSNWSRTNNFTSPPKASAATAKDKILEYLGINRNDAPIPITQVQSGAGVADSTYRPVVRKRQANWFKEHETELVRTGDSVATKERGERLKAMFTSQNSWVKRDLKAAYMSKYSTSRVTFDKAVADLLALDYFDEIPKSVELTNDGLLEANNKGYTP